MAEGYDLNGILGDVAQYFIDCRANAAKGSAAERRFTIFIDAVHEAREKLNAQEHYHRLQVHNIGNVDIPDGVTLEQFRAVMNNVVAALEHTDNGESWPYDHKPVVGQAFSPD